MRYLSRSLLLLTILLPPVAFAALGGNVEPVTNSQAIARAQLRVTPGNGYTVHEQLTEAGISVREYASPQGIVFAVTWSGPNLPDIQQLLGNYFPEFSNAMTERRSRGVRGPVAFKQDDLVVESRGHVRDFQGRAYVPSLLPPQVSIEEIQ